MLRVSRLTDYALVLLTRLAGCGDAPQSAQALAQATRLQPPMVSKALKQLCQSGWISSIRGSKGGYVLTRDAAQIAVLDVVEAFEGPIVLAQCESQDGACTLHESCRLRPHWQLINNRLRRELAALSVAELSQPPRIADLPAREAPVHEQ